MPHKGGVKVCVEKESVLDILGRCFRTLLSHRQLLGAHGDFPLQAWTAFTEGRYDATSQPDRSRMDGLGRPLPYVSIEVPPAMNSEVEFLNS